MPKPFILLLMFQTGAGQTALCHMEVPSAQICDAAQAKLTRVGVEADRRDEPGAVT